MIGAASKLVVARGAKETKRKANPQMPVWMGKKYSRVVPGKYTAVAEELLGPYYLRPYTRYSVGVVFRLLDDPDKEVVLFLNLGRNMEPTRCGRFYRAWCIANGEPPSRGQPMDFSVFFEHGLIYEIEVVDGDKDAEGQQKQDAEIYSKVARIISVTRNTSAPSPIISFSKRKASFSKKKATSRQSSFL